MRLFRTTPLPMKNPASSLASSIVTSASFCRGRYSLAQLPLTLRTDQKAPSYNSAPSVLLSCPTFLTYPYSHRLTHPFFSFSLPACLLDRYNLPSPHTVRRARSNCLDFVTLVLETGVAARESATMSSTLSRVHRPELSGARLLRTEEILLALSDTLCHQYVFVSHICPCPITITK